MFVLELFHTFWAVFVGPTDCADQVVAGEGVFDEGSAHMAGCTENQPYKRLRRILGARRVGGRRKVESRLTRGCWR
jgi:hypothetical protein